MSTKSFIQLLYILSLVLCQNRVLVLDGVDDYVSIVSPVINTPAFTIEAWKNMNGDGGSTNENNPIFLQRNETTGNGHTMTGLKSETNAYSNQNTGFTIRGSDNATQTIFSSGNEYNEWHHYACVVKLDSFRFYIYGDLVGSMENLQDGVYNQNIEHTAIGRLRFNGVTR